MECLIGQDWTKVKGNHERLRELWTRADPDLLLVNAQLPDLVRTSVQST